MLNLGPFVFVCWGDWPHPAWRWPRVWGPREDTPTAGFQVGPFQFQVGWRDNWAVDVVIGTWAVSVWWW